MVVTKRPGTLHLDGGNQETKQPTPWWWTKCPNTLHLKMVAKKHSTLTLPGGKHTASKVYATEWMRTGWKWMTQKPSLSLRHNTGEPENPSYIWGLTLVIHYQLNLKIFTTNKCTKIMTNFMVIRNFPPKTSVARQQLFWRTCWLLGMSSGYMGSSISSWRLEFFSFNLSYSFSSSCFWPASLSHLVWHSAYRERRLFPDIDWRNCDGILQYWVWKTFSLRDAIVLRV